MNEEPDRTTSRRTLIIVVTVVVALALIATGALWAVAVNTTVNSDQDPSPGVVLPFAGFGATDGLLLVSTHHEGFLDEQADFVLIGAPADIDRALERAEFKQAFTAGVHVQTATGFDPATVSAAKSAEDTWRRSGSGPIVHRTVVRGTSVEDPTKELLVVLAFTT